MCVLCLDSGSLLLIVGIESSYCTACVYFWLTYSRALCNPSPSSLLVASTYFALPLFNIYRMPQGRPASSRLPFQEPAKPTSVLLRAQEQPKNLGQTDPQNQTFQESHGAKNPISNRPCSEDDSLWYSDDESGGVQFGPGMTSKLSALIRSGAGIRNHSAWAPRSPTPRDEELDEDTMAALSRDKGHARYIVECGE